VRIVGRNSEAYCAAVLRRPEAPLDIAPSRIIPAPSPNRWVVAMAGAIRCAIAPYALRLVAEETARATVAALGDLVGNARDDDASRAR
jgi:hypothetical protein